MLYFDKLHARIRMHIYMLTHAWTPPFLTWTRTIPHGLHWHSTDPTCSKPLDQWTSIKAAELGCDHAIATRARLI